MANFQKITELLQKKNLAKGEFCKRVGITTQGLRELIARNSTSTETIERIAEALNVHVGFFFDDSDYIEKGRAGLENKCQAEVELLKNIIAAKEQVIQEKDNVIYEKERLLKVLIKDNNIEL